MYVLVESSKCMYFLIEVNVCSNSDTGLITVNVWSNSDTCRERMSTSTGWTHGKPQKTVSVDSEFYSNRDRKISIRLDCSRQL
jgi:hypothetical protein